MSNRTLAAGAAIGVAYAYLAWLGWKDVLIPPQPRAGDSFEALAAPGPPSPAAEATSWTWPARRALESRLASAATAAMTAGTAEAGMKLAPGGAPSAAAPSSPAGRSFAGGPETGGPRERRSPTAPNEDSSPASDPSAEEKRDEPRARMDLGGSVLDREGSPVAGLPVRAGARRLFGSPGDAAASGGLVTATDGAGRFSFAGVPDGEYEVRTDETATYDKAAAVLRAGVDSAVLVVGLKSGRTLHVHGTVASARGGVLKGARVEVAGNPALAASSDDGGRYGVRVPAGSAGEDVVLRVAREGYREQRVAIVAAEAAGDEVARDFNLEPVGALGAVNGSVRGADGRPVPRASVQFLSARLARRYQAASDGDGRFTVAGVEESDDYRLWVRPASGYRDHVRESVAIGPQGATLDVVLEALGAAGLRGSIVDSEGRPIPGFTLWLRSAYGAPRSVAATGDAQGRFEVSDLPEGAMAIETRAAPRLSVTGVELAAGAVRDVRIPLDIGPHRLEGSLLGEGGAPVGGARVALVGQRTDGGITSRSFRETVTDSRGYFAFTQIGSGKPTLSVTADGFRSVRLQPAVGPLTPPLQIELLANP